jgi:hypothetical protein
MRDIAHEDFHVIKVSNLAVIGVQVETDNLMSTIDETFS